MMTLLRLMMNLIKPNLAGLWIVKGDALCGMGNYNEAIEAYDEALKLNPKLVMAWNDKAWVLNSQGKYDEALKACDEALRVNPNLAVVWINKVMHSNHLARHLSLMQPTFAKAKELGYRADSSL